jgi:hypothetical protein
MLTFLGVRNFDALSVASSELPAMEWALQTVAHNSPSNSEISAHMWAIGINDVSFSIFCPKHGQI